MRSYYPSLSLALRLRLDPQFQANSGNTYFTEAKGTNTLEVVRVLIIQGIPNGAGISAPRYGLKGLDEGRETIWIRYRDSNDQELVHQIKVRLAKGVFSCLDQRYEYLQKSSETESKVTRYETEDPKKAAQWVFNHLVFAYTRILQLDEKEAQKQLELQELFCRAQRLASETPSDKNSSSAAIKRIIGQIAKIAKVKLDHDLPFDENMKHINTILRARQELGVLLAIVNDPPDFPELGKRLSHCLRGVDQLVELCKGQTQIN